MNAPTDIHHGAVTRATELLQTKAGFRPDPMLQRRLARCLRDAADAAGLPVEAYVLTLDGDAAALQALIDRVTIQESSFFRDGTQFDTLATEVLPTLASGDTIWSAGCANGQEVWSLAILLDEQQRTDCTVLGTDISEAALARAERGRYSARELRGLSDRRRDRYFVASGGEFEVVPELRRLVRFAHHNLGQRGAPAPGSRIAVVLCRNVLIYLTDEEISEVLDRFATVLGPSGLLFLGHAESLWRLPSRFALRRLGESFVYSTGGVAPKKPPAVTLDLADRSHAPVDVRPVPSHEPFLADGEAAVARGDLPAAVTAFRKAAYLRPDDASVMLSLAFALDALGEPEAARPWFRVARDVLAAGAAPSQLDGWSAIDLRAFLDRKLALPAVAQ